MKKISFIIVSMILMVSCADKGQNAELQALQLQYDELEQKYTALSADYEVLQQKYADLEQDEKNTPAPQNNCCGEAAALRQKMANAKKSVRKLKDDFNDFQSGFGITNMIDIDNRIKAVERALQ